MTGVDQTSPAVSNSARRSPDVDVVGVEAVGLGADVEAIAGYGDAADGLSAQVALPARVPRGNLEREEVALEGGDVGRFAVLGHGDVAVDGLEALLGV